MSVINQEITLSEKHNQIFNNVDMKIIIYNGLGINIIVTLLFNLIFLVFVRKEYIKLIQVVAIHNFAIISFLVVCFGIFVSYCFSVEAKMQRAYSHFYYQEKSQQYSSIFTFLTTCLFSFVIAFQFTSIFLNSEDFVTGLLKKNSFFIIFLMFIFWIFLIAYYNYFFKKFLVGILEKWQYYIYDFIPQLNTELNFVRVQKSPFTMAYIKIANIEKIKAQFRISNKKIINIFIELMKTELRKTDLIVFINAKEGSIGFFDRIDSYFMEKLVKERVKYYFDKPLLVYKQNTQFELEFEIHDIASNKNINNAYDIINTFIA